MTTAAVVLAAGGSSRFAGSTSKLRVAFRGRLLVEWALQSASEAGFDGVVVITGHDDLADVVPAEVAVRPNPRWALGQSTSLQEAVSWATEQGHDAIVVGLADQPMIPASAWAAVAAADAPIAVATYAGQRRNPVRLHRSVWPLLPVEGDVGARELIRARPDLVREVACEGEPVDIDTVEDLQRWS